MELLTLEQLTENKGNEISSPKSNIKEDNDYQKFFQAKLKKYHVKSPAELTDKAKESFYAEIEREWTKDDKNKVDESDFQMEVRISLEGLDEKDIDKLLSMLKKNVKRYRDPTNLEAVNVITKYLSEE